MRSEQRRRCTPRSLGSASAEVAAVLVAAAVAARASAARVSVWAEPAAQQHLWGCSLRRYTASRAA